MLDAGMGSSCFTLFGRKIHKAWLMLVGCCFLQAGSLGPILLTAGVFYVPICTELGFARSEMSLWMTAYFLATIPAMPIAGKILQRYNVRVPMTVSIIAVAIAVGMMSTYEAIWQWVASGLVIGLFGSCVMALPTAAIIGEWFAKGTGLAMGVSAACSALSGVIMSPILASLIEAFGWRSAYLFAMVIVLSFCLPWSIFVFTLRPKDVGALPFGLAQRGAAPSRDGKNEDRSKGDLRDIPFKKAVFSISFIMICLFGCVASFLGSGFDAHLPGFTQSIGFDAAFGAMMLSALQGGSFVDKLLMGVLNDRIGVQKTVYIELIVVTCGLLGLLFLRQPVLLIISAFLFGVQDSLNTVSAPLLVRQLFGVESYVELYSWFRVGCGIVGAFASVLVGLAFDLSGSFTPAFMGGLAVVVVAAVAIFVAYACRGRLIEKPMPNDLIESV